MKQKSYFEIISDRWVRIEELRNKKNKTPEQEKEYSDLIWLSSITCFPVKRKYCLLNNITA